MQKQLFLLTVYGGPVGAAKAAALMLARAFAVPE